MADFSQREIVRTSHTWIVEAAVGDLDLLADDSALPLFFWFLSSFFFGYSSLSGSEDLCVN